MVSLYTRNQLGLDTVEFVLLLEDEYRLEFPAEELINISTVGEISRYVATKHNLENGTSFSYEDILPKIVEILVKDFDVPRQKINTTSCIVKDLGLQ